MVDKISEQEARLAYLALGPHRTLAKVAEQFGARSVSIRWLEHWSKEGEWQRRAAEHDEQLAKRAERRIMTQQTNERVQTIRLMRDTADALLRRLADVAARVGAEKGADAKGLADAATALLKHVELLEGGATERAEINGASRLPDDDRALLERINAKLGGQRDN